MGCLLLHGFTATPQEVRWLGEQLHADGYTAHGVCLAGHATSVDDLARTSWRDWLASAREGLLELRRHTETTVVVGLSMGSLLALTLAHEQPAQVDGIVALSTALLIRERRIERYLPLLGMLTPLLPMLPSQWRNVPKDRRDIADLEARAASPAYEVMPLRSLINLVQLQLHVRPLLKEIRQPVLAVHARQDHACPLANLDFLRESLPTPPQVKVLEHSYHVITVDYEKELVANLVRDFVARLAGNRGLDTNKS